MRKLSLRAGAAVVASALTCALVGTAGASTGPSTTRVPDNVPPWATAAHEVGHAPKDAKMHVTVYLSLRHQDRLNALLHDLYTPGSGSYHQWLTPAQFHARFGPSASDVAAVKALLSRNLKVTGGSFRYVDATGTVAQVERTFGVTENIYRHAHMKLRANAQNPAVPSSLASKIAFIGGLDQSERLIRPLASSSPKAAPGPSYATPGPCSTFWGDKTSDTDPPAGFEPAHQYDSHIPWTPCGYTPQQMRAAYGLPADPSSEPSGAGVTVGITDAFASPTIVGDVNQFSRHYGLPQLTSSNFTQIVHPGIYNHGENILDPAGWYGEETLDIEWVHSLAPGADIVYAGANSSTTPLDHALEDLIDQNRVDVITNSWGIYGEYTQYGHYRADEAAFQQAAAQGISVLFSSGDDGDVQAITGIAQASYPASSPWVTAVGGTSLGVRDASGTKYEWGWGTYYSALCNDAAQAASACSADEAGTWTPWPPVFFYGSGGGVSLHFLQPAYQSGVVPDSVSTQTTTSSGGTIRFSSPHRATPDVAMDADPNTGGLYGQSYQPTGDPYVDAGCQKSDANPKYIYCERRIGGTSLASPMFAGATAVAIQANGGHRVGFLNPALYRGYKAGAATGLDDVLAPAQPTSVLRSVLGFDASGNDVIYTTLRTINSVPSSADGSVIEGADSSLRTRPGWDDVTGLGAPDIPAYAAYLSSLGG